ncbi:MAG: hypothetical protein JWM80_547 [Cyanobacteria bacterium RYN_339]|nr:hypothetical protein [Cyanobacteria bacterium RYN_339]
MLALLLAAAFPLLPTGDPDVSAPARRPVQATDGDRTTWWGSAPGFPAWISVDLGAPTRLDRLAIDWEPVTYPTAYRVEASADGTHWCSVLHVAAWGGETHDERRMEPVTARWLRVTGEAGPNHWGMWLSELSVFGPADPKRNLAAGRPTSASGTIARALTPADKADVADAIAIGDRLYHAHDFAGALAHYRAVYNPLGWLLRAQEPRTMFEALRLRVLSADFRLRHPNARAERPRKLVMLVVPRTDLVLPGPPEAPAPIQVHRALDESQVALTREGLFWFSESFLALTDGRVGWDVSVERLEGYTVAAQSRVVYTRDAYQLMAQLEPGGISPSIQPVLDRHADADMFYIFWPGTHPGLQQHVTNGGSGTVWAKGTSRACLLSEGDACEPYGFYNTLTWFHHEFFHQVEFGYWDQDFPKEPMHAWQDRPNWPADFVGEQEWDFYENVYRRRVLPLDGLDRMTWSTGLYPRGIWSHPGP